jgi:hypothetical protein
VERAGSATMRLLLGSMQAGTEWGEVACASVRLTTAATCKRRAGVTSAWCSADLHNVASFEHL